VKPFTPEFRAWLEQELTWGSRAIREISRQRGAADEGLHGLERFTVRMGLVELTGSIAAWAHGLQAGLLKVGAEQAAARFAMSPPFAGEIAGDDYGRLEDYVASRVELLGELLADTPPASQPPD
jgi:hypothetical protein